MGLALAYFAKLDAVSLLAEHAAVVPEEVLFPFQPPDHRYDDRISTILSLFFKK